VQEEEDFVGRNYEEENINEVESFCVVDIQVWRCEYLKVNKLVRKRIRRQKVEVWRNWSGSASMS